MPATSLLLNSAVINSLDLIEQLQRVDFEGRNTLVDARGAGDRYVNKQVVKQKQVVNFTGHWYNASSEIEATNLDITLWKIGGTSYLGQLKRGSIEVSNTGPEVSGIAVAYEVTVPTATDVSITADLIVLTEAFWTDAILTDTAGEFQVQVQIEFAGEPILVPGILRTSKHTLERGAAQMENVTIDLSGGAPATSFSGGPSDTSSLLYQAMVNSGVCVFDIDTGVNVYATGSGQSAFIKRFGLKFADKALIEQSITLEVQGAMSVTAGS